VIAYRSTGAPRHIKCTRQKGKRRTRRERGGTTGKQRSAGEPGRGWTEWPCRETGPQARTPAAGGTDDGRKQG